MDKISFLFKMTVKDLRYQFVDVFGREDSTLKFDISEISDNKDDYSIISEAIYDLGINREEDTKEVVLSNGDKFILEK